MKEEKVWLVFVAVTMMGLLPFAWPIGAAIAAQGAGPQPMSWPFILLPFVGVFYALHQWPITEENKH